ncbi:hypothetical protein [Paralimibaculum aggregatum]|nr:hypothetical protein [Limibaculum sp. NKW23]
MDANDRDVDLEPTFKRFPQDRAMLALLIRTNAVVRIMCEEHAMATTALDHFEQAPDAERRPEVAEYRALKAELEVELETVIQDARQLRLPGEPGRK